MNTFLKNLILPNEENNFRAKILHHHVLFGLSLVFLFFNVLVFPGFGLTKKAQANSQINIPKLIQLTNEERAKSGVPLLQQNEQLVKAAQLKGNDMLQKQYWGHYGPNKETPWQFMTQNNYNYIYGGENLAKNFFDENSLMKAWLASPSHKQNIVNPNFNEIGISIVEGKIQGKEVTLVIEMFGSTAGSPTARSNTSAPTLPVNEILQTKSSSDVLGVESEKKFVAIQNVKSSSLSSKINVLFLFALLTVVGIDVYFVWHKRVKKEHSSHISANFVLILLILFAAISFIV